VRSVRGAGGGYLLAKYPSKIKISEIVRILEGSFSIADCVEDESLCTRAEDCVTRDVWRDLGNTIENMLSGITLDDLIARTRERVKKSHNYHI